jgi:urea transport system substrate-binding protein
MRAPIWIRGARDTKAEQLRELQEDFMQRYVPRREFIRRATAAGLTLGGASAFLAACGDSNNSGGGDSGRTIKMGALIPLTGVFSVLSAPMENNAKLAVDDVNKTGGANGSKIELIIEDTASDPDTAVQKARKLIRRDQVDLMIGTLGSASRWAVALGATAPAKTIFINPTYYEGGICDRYFFNVGALPNQQIDPFIPWLVEQHGVSSFYLGGSDYAWPRGSFEALKNALAEAGGSVVGEEYSPVGTTDFATTLRRIQAEQPDVVFPLYAGADGIAFLKQLVGFGIQKSSLVASSAISELIIPALPKQESAGWFASFEYFMSIDTPENQDFVRAYQARFGRNALMDSIGEGMRTCVELYVNGVENAKSLDKEAVVDGMVKARFDDPKGEIHIDEPTHCAYLNDYVAEITKPQAGEPAWRRLKVRETFTDIAPQQPCLDQPPS